MTKETIKNVLIALLVLGAFNIPGYLEYARGHAQAKEFSEEAALRQVESKVVRWSHDFTNPFTWGRGIPNLVVARESQGDRTHLMVYSLVSQESKEMNKALVWADCDSKQMRLVTQDRYEDALYDVFGNRLPIWDDADYRAMSAVLIQIPLTPANQSIYFDIACRWEKYSSL
jgi:hypothetical protein